MVRVSRAAPPAPPPTPALVWLCYLHTAPWKGPPVVKEATWRRRGPAGHSCQPAPSHQGRSGSLLPGGRQGSAALLLTASCSDPAWPVVED